MIKIKQPDPLLKEIVTYLQEADYITSPSIQRQFSIGYARSARILDQLEELGFISPHQGSKPRKVFHQNLNLDFNLSAADQVKTLIETTISPELQAAQEVKADLNIQLGTNEKKKRVKFNFEQYGNLILIGSPLTGASQLINKIISQQIKEQSSESLKVLIIDGQTKSIKLSNDDPQLLTPIITDSKKASSALSWLCMEIAKRLKLSATDLKKQKKILLIINNFNAINYPTGEEIEAALARIFTLGKTVKVYTLVGFDHLDSNFRKDLLVNVGAKMVFKPSTIQLAHSSGIPESIELTKPNKAILETMWNGKEKLEFDFS